MSDTPRSIPQIDDVSTVSARRLPFDDGLAETQPIDLSEIAWELERHTRASAPSVAA